MNHIDELTYLRHLDGQLSESRSVEVANHASACTACGRLLQALERETALLREALGEADELPERFENASQELSWAWLSVAGLAVFGWYALWQWVLEPWWNGLQSVGIGRQTLVSVLLFRGLLWEGWTTMADKVFQGLSVILITTVLAATIHWSARLRRTWTRMIIIMAAVLLLPFNARAAVIETDHQSYVLAEGQVIANDLIVMAKTVRIEGTIEGDLIALAQSVTVNGHVAGDVLVAAQRLDVNGRVDGSVRAAGEFHDLNGSIGRNVTVFGEMVQLHAGAEVEGSFTSASESSNLAGRVGRDVIIFAETAELDGAVGGGARLFGERLVIGPHAAIQGEIRIHGAEEPEVSPEANLTTPPEIEPFEEPPTHVTAATFLWRFLAWSAAFVYGMMVFLLAPRFFGSVLQSMPRYGIAIGIGAAALVTIPVLAVIVCLTLVGLPLGLLGLAVYAVAIYSAQVFVGAWLGQRLLGQPTSKGQTIGRLAVGLALIHLVRLIPLVGSVVSLVVSLWGLGALLLGIFRPRRLEALPVG